jgi:serine/threonine-protein kinase
VIPAGTPVGTYLIKSVLGGGGVATVYQATDEEGQTVALKVLNENLSDDEVVLVRFHREGAMRGKLEHPHIVQVFEAKHSDYGLYIAMQLIGKGETLDNLLLNKDLEPWRQLKKALEPDRAIELLTPIADALDYANSKEYIHRDVKPSNILLSEEGPLYLTDFGIAKSMADRPITRTGPSPGSPGYASPEQVKGKRLTSRSDVYSFAAVLFKSLTGEVPIPAAKGRRFRRRGRLPLATSKNAALPPAIDDVLAKGLARRPRRRYQSATHLIQEAEKALERDVADSPAAAQPVSGSRSVSLCLVLLGLSFGLGLGLGVASSGSNEAKDPVTAVGTGVQISVPPEWRSEPSSTEAAVSWTPSPFSFAPPVGSNAGPRLVSAGVSSAVGPTLLPAVLRHEWRRNGGRRTAVVLGSLQAYRYAGMEVPGSSDSVTVFVAPTSRGVATVACLLPPGGRERPAAHLCDDIASTMKLRRGRGFRLGPALGLAKALRRRIALLEEGRKAALAQMGKASSADGQASAAAKLTKAFKDAARGIAVVRIPSQSASAKEAILVSLRAARDASNRVADAAAREDGAGYAAASTELKEAEADLSDRLRALKRLGYAVG